MTSPSPHAPSQAGARQLADHVEQCADCRQAPPPLHDIMASLDRSPAVIDAAALSARTLVRLGPVLERRVTVRLWRRVLAGVLLGLLPLPAVVAYNAYLLLFAYALVRTLLPATFAAYLVLSDAALLVLLFGATYAAIPIMLSRRRVPTLAAQE